MPECVLLGRGCRRAVRPPPAGLASRSPDLVVLGWQTWFLSPALPVALALRAPAWRAVLRGRRVVTVGTHRNMWHAAQAALKLRGPSA